MFMLYTLKYCPINSSEVIGQPLLELKSFIENYTKGYVLLSGPTGTGKTSSVHAIAKELDLEIVEINASETRNKDAVNSIIGVSLKQQSLFSKGKVILIDEIDAISGRSDYGGLVALKKVISKSSFPVVLTCNDASITKLKELKKQAVKIKFVEVDYLRITELLRRICLKENVVFEEPALTLIARRSGGDVRAALNDLQTLALSDSITIEEAQKLDERKQEKQIQEGLFKVFKSTDPAIFLGAFDDFDDSEITLWLEENIPREYEDIKEIEKAFNFLSKVDVFKGRIRKRQYWRLLYYIHQFLTAGIALSKKEKYKKQVEYKRSLRLLSIWQSNMKNASKKKMAEDFSKHLHVSKNRFLKDVYFYFRIMMENPAFFGNINEELSKKRI
jgi:replication factor C large subunit